MTARLEAKEWDLHVTDLMHGAPEGAMITPQCRSRSKVSMPRLISDVSAINTRSAYSCAAFCSWSGTVAD